MTAKEEADRKRRKEENDHVLSLMKGRAPLYRPGAFTRLPPLPKIQKDESAIRRLYGKETENALDRPAEKEKEEVPGQEEPME